MSYQPSQLPPIDAVELVDLKGLRPCQVSEYMKIAQTAPQVRIEGELAQQIAQLWRQLPAGEQMRCHNPPFGLRFYRKNNLLSQGSVCWQCNNIFLEMNGEALTYQFDGSHHDSQQLLGLLQQINDLPKCGQSVANLSA
jgi:hypothetical protein